MNLYYNNIILIIIQVIAIYNAINLGWEVTKIGQNKYKLSKQIDKLDEFDLKQFINKITSIK